MHKFYKFALGTTIAVLVTSCGDFQIPESVSVKTDAKFQVPLGTAAYDVSKNLNSSAMRQTIQDSIGSGVTIYDYVSPENPDALNYLIRYPGMTVPVDIGEALSNLNLDDALGDFSQDFSFKAGDPINLTQKQTIDLPDFSSVLSQTVEAEATSQEFSEMTTPTLASDLLPEIKISGGTADVSYTRIYYSSGAIKLTFAQTDSNPFSSNYEFNVLAKLKDESNNIIAQSNNGSLQDITKNQTIVIPLTSSLGIPDKFHITFEGNTKNGNSSIKHTLKVTGIFDNVMPSKVTGVTATNMDALGLTSDILDESFTIDLGSSIPDALKSISFDNAKFKIKIANPTGWSGVSLNLPDSNGLVFEGASSSVLTKTSISDSNLVNAEYNWEATINTSSTHSLTAKVHPELSINNATIKLENGKTNLSVNCETSLSLSSLKSATIDFTSFGASSISLPTDGSEGSVELPNDLLKFVNGIKFSEYASDSSGNETSTKRDGFGLKCTVTNTLPAGNDIDLTLQAFNKTPSGYCFEKNVSIPANTTNKTETWTSYIDIELPKADGGKKYLPFNVLIDNANNFTVKNLVLGTNYQMKIKVDKIVMDWDSVSLNLSGINYNGTMNFDFSVSSLMENFSIAGDMLDNISLRSFPMYIFAEKSPTSTVFNGMGLQGKMYVSYKDNGAEKYLDIFNNASQKPTSYKDMKLVSGVQWPADSTKEIKGNSSDPSNIAYYLNETNSSSVAELKELLSLKNVSDTVLNYDIGIKNGANKTVYAASLEGSSKEDLVVEYAMMLSFDFDLKAPLTVNIMEFADKDYNKKDENGAYSDILQREDASTFEKFTDYMDSIEYFGFNYTVNNQLIKNLELSARINDKNGQTGLTKTLDFTQGVHKEKFTKDEIKSIMTKFPFHPDIEIQIGRDLTDSEKSSGKYGANERFTISRAGANSSDSLSSQVIVVVQMDGNTPISVWQKN